MGWARAMAAISSATGDNPRAWMWLATDFMDSIGERNIRQERREIEEWNRKNAIAPNELPRLLAWIVGEEFLSTYNGNFEDIQFIDQWNSRHGHTLKLFFNNGIEHNFGQMCYLWIKVGKP